MSQDLHTPSWMTDATPATPVAVVNHPSELVARAEADPAFHALNQQFQRAGITNWLYEPEKALHYGIGAFAPGNGVIVEIGTFEGGSAMFSAGGIARRGHGRLVSVDPHFGGPPWLGMAPHQRTVDKFRKHAAFCDVQPWIESRIGDSSAVASVWHGEPITATFIDADHSYLGALKDFEVWGSKLLPGGLALFDDADDPCLPELLELIEDLKAFTSVKYIGITTGVAVFRREATPIGKFLNEIAALSHRRKIYRPWDMSNVHNLPVPSGYAKSALPNEPGMGDAYQLCYLARCKKGQYGFSPMSSENDRKLIQAVSRDRADGPVTELTADSPANFRAIVCRPEELPLYAPKLIPGGVCISRNVGSTEQTPTLQVRQLLLDVGLEGCGWNQAIHWGVWKPFELSADTVFRLTYEAYQAA